MSSVPFVASRHYRTHQPHIYHRTIVNDVLAKCQTSASERIEWLLEMENKSPFASNEDYLLDYRDKYLKSYREARAHQLRAGNYSRTESLVARDSYDQALLYMASARAYFQGLQRFLSSTSGGSLTIPSVTFKRFTDLVPMAIDQELLRGLDWDRGLRLTLAQGLGVTGPGSLDKAKEYLQELPDVRSRRESLQKKRERLESAKRELQSI